MTNLNTDSVAICPLLSARPTNSMTLKKCFSSLTSIFKYYSALGQRHFRPGDRIVCWHAYQWWSNYKHVNVTSCIDRPEGNSGMLRYKIYLLIWVRKLKIYIVYAVGGIWNTCTCTCKFVLITITRLYINDKGVFVFMF